MNKDISKVNVDPENRVVFGINLIEIQDFQEVAYIMERCANSFYDQSVNNKNQILKLAEKFSKSARFIVAVDVRREEICGFTAFYCNDINTKVSFLSMIIIRDDYQGKGIGKVLLDDCVERCKLEGMETFRLEVNCQNHKAISFYKKNHFKCIKKTETSYFLEKKI